MCVLLPGPGQYALQVWWSGEDDLEYFTLRCRNEEQMKMWENQINRLIHDIAGRRGTGASASDRLSGTNRVRNTGEPSPQPRYPPTTYDRQATMSTASQFGRAAGATRPTTPYGSDFSGPGGYPGHGGFELDGEDEFEDYPPALSMPPSGRGTPSGTRSRAGSRTPVGYEDDVSTTTTSSTARYRQNGGPVPPAVNGLPSGPAVRGSLSRPSMSRLSSAASGGSATSAESFGPGASQRPGLRSQFSSTRLKNAFDSSGSPNDSRVSLPPNRISGASSQLSRSRSVSQPTAYVPKPVPPPLPTNGNWEDGTVQSEDGSKRGSGSSQATTESSDNVSSPVTPYGSSDSSLGSYEAPVKVKVHFHEDIFVVHMPVHSEFADLVEKVGKKIRLCGPRRDDGPLRLKYQGISYHGLIQPQHIDDFT
jgi:cell division control protein 24